MLSHRTLYLIFGLLVACGVTAFAYLRPASTSTTTSTFPTSSTAPSTPATTASLPTSTTTPASSTTLSTSNTTTSSTSPPVPLQVTSTDIPNELPPRLLVAGSTAPRTEVVGTLGDSNPSAVLSDDDGWFALELLFPDPTQGAVSVLRLTDARGAGVSGPVTQTLPLLVLDPVDSASGASLVISGRTLPHTAVSATSFNSLGSTTSDASGRFELTASLFALEPGESFVVTVSISSPTFVMERLELVYES